MVGFTVIVPNKESLPQGPTAIAEYGKVPDAVGVPEIVKTPALYEPETPTGKFIAMAS